LTHSDRAYVIASPGSGEHEAFLEVYAEEALPRLVEAEGRIATDG
jgi:hypothetical protein